MTEQPEKGAPGYKFERNRGNIRNTVRREQIQEKIDAGKCTFISCDKKIESEDLCRNHHLELVANLNGTYMQGVHDFCRRGGLDFHKIARKHGLLRRR
jgi:hypothetical protein